MGPSMSRPRPAPLLTVRVRDFEVAPSLLALCAGFEAGEWRSDQLARHLFDWLLDFAFTQSELELMDHANAAEFLARAAMMVYDTDTYAARGEFGELLLHAIVRQEFDSEPAISKVFFKDTPNATVHGFDAVHVVTGNAGELELWLGEAKFYGNPTAAMTAVAKELREHTDRDWLRTEFLAIGNKLDRTWTHAKAVRELIHRNRPIEEIFERIRIPVLVTYDSQTVAKSRQSDAAYAVAFEQEVREHWRRFARRRLPTEVVIHLLLLPLASKQRLVDRLDHLLRAVQELAK
jgi:Cap4 SAVED domain